MRFAVKPKEAMKSGGTLRGKSTQSSLGIEVKTFQQGRYEKF